jgi:cell division protein FtsQ
VDEPIDPRIEARRHEVAADAVRRRARRTASAFVLLASLTAGVLATRSPLLDVDRVEVRGSVRTPADAVVGASGIGHGVPLTELDARAAALGVEALPWVADARVSTSWPGTVVITVAEREPASLVHTPGGLAVVDRGGRVLEVLAPDSDEARAVDALGAGPEVESSAALEPGAAVPDVLAGAVALAAGLDAELAPSVERVRVEDDELWFELVPRGEVRVGSLDDLGAKLLALRTMLVQVDLRCLDRMDVRAPASPVLTRNRACERVSTETRD